MYSGYMEREHCVYKRISVYHEGVAKRVCIVMCVLVSKI